MKTVLVVLEHHFFMDRNGNVWCERVVDYRYLQRYLMSFDNVVVCARMRECSHSQKRWKLASGPHVEYQPIKDFYGGWGSIKNIFNVHKAVKSGLIKADACIIRCPSPISILAYSTIKKASKPFALELVMGADKLFVSEKWFYKLINQIINAYTKKMCMEANGCSYVTKYLLQRKYPTKGFTNTYSSIDLDQNDFSEKKGDIFNKPEEYIIVNTGYMDDMRKGQHIAIMATAILVGRGYKVRLKLIGDGQYRCVFEQMVYDLNMQNIVDFVGLVSNKEELLNILKESHIFVLPSQSEGLPRSVLEAFAVGLPCVTSDVDGIPELVDREYMISSFKEVDYANKIEQLINDWPKMLELGRRNYAKAQEYRKDLLDIRKKEFYDNLKRCS